MLASRFFTSIKVAPDHYHVPSSPHHVFSAVMTTCLRYQLDSVLPYSVLYPIPLDNNQIYDGP